MTTTALDIITNALVRIGEVGVGEPISAEDAEVGFNLLNDILDSRSVERLNAWTIRKQSFNLTINKQDYTFGAAGSGADFTAIGRPVEILAGAAIDSAGVPTPLNILDFAAWLQLRTKGATYVVPTDVYLDQDYPLSGAHFHPIPSTGCAVELFYMFALPSFTTLTDPFLFPPGYQQWLTMELAVLLCPVYTKPVDPTIGNEMTTCRGRVQNMNMETLKSFFGESRLLEGANREGALPPPAQTPPIAPAR